MKGIRYTAPASCARADQHQWGLFEQVTEYEPDGPVASKAVRLVRHWYCVHCRALDSTEESIGT